MLMLFLQYPQAPIDISHLPIKMHEVKKDISPGYNFTSCVNNYLKKCKLKFIMSKSWPSKHKVIPITDLNFPMIQESSAFGHQNLVWKATL